MHLHYFVGGNDWWITELDHATMLAFGYARLAVCPDMAEWGYIDVTELEAIRIDKPFPLIVERDLSWQPRPAGQCIPDLVRNGGQP